MKAFLQLGARQALSPRHVLDMPTARGVTRSFGQQAFSFQRSHSSSDGKPGEPSSVRLDMMRRKKSNRKHAVSPRRPRASASDEGIIHDKAYIKATYAPLCADVDVPLKALENPVSWLTEAYGKVTGIVVPCDLHEVQHLGKQLFRARVKLKLEEEVVAIGHSTKKQHAKANAFTSAIYQALSKKLLVYSGKRPDLPVAVPMADGSTLTYPIATKFIDYYCRKFKFPPPTINYEAGLTNRFGTTWDAVMSINGRNVGVGKAHQKKDASIQCFLSVVRYMEHEDPALWKEFVNAAKTGADVGMTRGVFFEMSWTLRDSIRRLRMDMEHSKLYRSRPRENASDADIDLHTRMYRPRFSPASLRKRDQELLERREKYLSDPDMESMRASRRMLPIFTKSKELVDQIGGDEITICLAATGSGKTTQIPQIILDSYIDKGEGSSCNIICTQPRRLAAISVAERVASERGEVIGEESVGYAVRHESKRTRQAGSIEFCTTGVLLKVLQGVMKGDAKGMDHISHIVVDEVHERDINTDLLLMLLRRIVSDRRARGKPLKVVLMSATIDPQLFKSYFATKDGKEASVIEIPGRTFPVERHYLEDFLPDISKLSKASVILSGVEAARHFVQNEQGLDEDMKDDIDIPYPLLALAITHVMQKSEDGHVLVFLPGWDEIVKAKEALTKSIHGVDFNDSTKFSIHTLHSSVSVAEQQQIFSKPPPGVRRIILSTNIAETSVTIPDVVYVVDCGRTKEQRYNPHLNISTLVSAWTGVSNLNQRAGRAGRHRPGEYFGMYSKRRLETLNLYQTVEMKRVDLSGIVMQVKALDLPGMNVDEALAATIEPPDAERVAAAVNNLQAIGALDRAGELSPLGKLTLALSVDAHIGRLVLFSIIFRCVDQGINLAVLLSSRSPFVQPLEARENARHVKQSWAPKESYSDLFAALKAYNEWNKLHKTRNSSSARQWSFDNFISRPSFLAMDRLKHHLSRSISKVRVIDAIEDSQNFGSRSSSGAHQATLNVNNASYPLLTALVALTSQPRFALRMSPFALRTAQDRTVMIHPSSINAAKRQERTPVHRGLFAFGEKKSTERSAVRAADIYLHETTPIDFLTYILFGANEVHFAPEGLVCDGWLPFFGNRTALEEIQKLKSTFGSVLERVYEGILAHGSEADGHRQRHLRSENSVIDAFDDDASDSKALTVAETVELEDFTRRIVKILTEYDKQYRAGQAANTAESLNKLLRL